MKRLSEYKIINNPLTIEEFRQENKCLRKSKRESSQNYLAEQKFLPRKW